jgi:Zn-dependent peptidase ImmA (M78 family)
MRYSEFSKDQKDFSPRDFGEMMEKFLKLVVEIYQLPSLPQIKIEREINLSGDQPSFGMYIADEQVLYVSLKDRHPVDILRTMAHELCHYKQDLDGALNHHSGKTGSREENEANSLAGIVMREFNKQYPDYMNLSAFF